MDWPIPLIAIVTCMALVLASSATHYAYRCKLLSPEDPAQVPEKNLLKCSFLYTLCLWLDAVGKSEAIVLATKSTVWSRLLGLYNALPRDADRILG